MSIGPQASFCKIVMALLYCCKSAFCLDSFSAVLWVKIDGIGMNGVRWVKRGVVLGNMRQQGMMNFNNVLSAFIVQFTRFCLKFG